MDYKNATHIISCAQNSKDVSFFLSTFSFFVAPCLSINTLKYIFLIENCITLLQKEIEGKSFCSDNSRDLSGALCEHAPLEPV